MYKPRIFFGPFVGELGWEQSFFSGYVRRFAQFASGQVEIHVASYPGRNVFYGEDVFFHAHPDWFASLPLSQNGYVADQWFGDWPQAKNPQRFGRDVVRAHDQLLDFHLAAIGEVDRVVAPARLFRCVIDPSKVWGTYFSPLRPLSPAPLTIRIEPSHQAWSHLTPSAAATRALNERYPGTFNDPDIERIAVLPRLRLGRRPDKNWPEEYYRDLIRRLQALRPSAKIILIGAPGGAYFAGGEVPGGTVDLINLPDERMRLDLHVAAIRQCRFAVGGLSGAMLMVLACGTPVVEWGYAHHEPETRRQNFLQTPLLYIAENMPSVDDVFALAREAAESPHPVDRTVQVPGLSGEVDEGRHPLPVLQRLRFAAFKRIDRALYTMAKSHILSTTPALILPARQSQEQI
jgi:hypothetical protein